MTRNRPTRRRLLASLLGVGAGTLAGCTGTANSGPTDRSPTDSPSPDTPATAASSTQSAHRDSTGLLLPPVETGGQQTGLVNLTPPDRVVLLDFFATWCPPCIPEMANLRAARDRFDHDEVAIISITRETDTAAIESFWAEHGGTWPVVMDPDLRSFRRFSVTSIPTIIVRRPDGTVVRRHTGLMGEQPIVSAIETALDAS